LEWPVICGARLHRSLIRTDTQSVDVAHHLAHEACVGGHLVNGIDVVPVREPVPDDSRRSASSDRARAAVPSGRPAPHSCSCYSPMGNEISFRVRRSQASHLPSLCPQRYWLMPNSWRRAASCILSAAGGSFVGTDVQAAEPGGCLGVPRVVDALFRIHSFSLSRPKPNTGDPHGVMMPSRLASLVAGRVALCASCVRLGKMRK